MHILLSYIRFFIFFICRYDVMVAALFYFVASQLGLVSSCYVPIRMLGVFSSVFGLAFCPLRQSVCVSSVGLLSAFFHVCFFVLSGVVIFCLQYHFFFFASTKTDSEKRVFSSFLCVFSFTFGCARSVLNHDVGSWK